MITDWKSNHRFFRMRCEFHRFHNCPNRVEGVSCEVWCRNRPTLAGLHVGVTMDLNALRCSQLWTASVRKQRWVLNRRKMPRLQSLECFYRHGIGGWTVLSFVFHWSAHVGLSLLRGPSSLKFTCGAPFYLGVKVKRKNLLISQSSIFTHLCLRWFPYRNVSVIRPW